MKCIIVEDQPPAQRILQKYIKDYGKIELVATFADAIKAIDFLNSNKVDLIFLDIHLPKLSGMDFLKAVSDAPPVILTTAFSEFALESYNFDVVDYLLKPFSFARFLKAANKVHPETAHVRAPVNQSIFIKSGHEHIKVDIREIIYIKSDADYTELFTTEQKLLSNETLKYWEEELKSENFHRVHRSYLINGHKIKKVRASMVYLKNDHEIPIGRAYKEEFEKVILKH
ncbi:LytR/AlgR family response regulator transcription factor [Portibacter marinus]|uniref:LytR/AlgR family response regulator transcription factor n=1 Tax=Portibacter marinus TaxID=2898660 RepID=UPI001F41E93C|nr:LytTR family DNA-binding domain-containing protein [Portibacter marinus]